MASQSLVISVIPDPFNSQLENLKSKSKTSQPSDKNTIRRPTRGIEISEDTFATLRVVSEDGRAITVVDAGSRATKDNIPLEINGKRANDVYSNFLLQTVQEERQEKAQILETFGEAYIFLFGERARVINCSGVLVNTQDFNWEAEWWENYDKFLRGTRCVETNSRVFLSYDNTLISGYILNSSATKSAQERNWVNFTFQLFVTGYTTLTDIGNPTAVKDAPRELNVTDADILNQRPVLAPELGGALADYARFENGLIKAPSLISGNFLNGALAAQTVLSTVGKIADGIQKFGNMALRLANNMLNGDVVRIPVGFAGAMAFDEDINVTQVPAVTDTGTITFTTYDKNDDEYVGRASHYGSSLFGLDGRNGDRPALFNLPDIEATFKNAQKQTNAARKVWESAGLAVSAQNFMANLTAEINPIKKLGLAVYTGVKTGAALINVIKDSNKAPTSSSFDSNFNPDANIQIPPAFKNRPTIVAAATGTKAGAGTKAHRLTPPKVK